MITMFVEDDHHDHHAGAFILREGLDPPHGRIVTPIAGERVVWLETTLGH